MVPCNCHSHYFSIIKQHLRDPQLRNVKMWRCPGYYSEQRCLRWINSWRGTMAEEILFVISVMHTDHPHTLVEDTDMNQAQFKSISKIRRQAVFFWKTTRVSALCFRLNSSCVPQILTPFKALLEAIPSTDDAEDCSKSDRVHPGFWQKLPENIVSLRGHYSEAKAYQKPRHNFSPRQF